MLSTCSSTSCCVTETTGVAGTTSRPVQSTMDSQRSAPTHFTASFGIVSVSLITHCTLYGVSRSVRRHRHAGCRAREH